MSRTLRVRHLSLCSRLLLAPIAATALAATAHRAGELFQSEPPSGLSRHSIRLDGRELTYRLYVPRAKAITDTGLQPLLLLFHGSGRDGMSVLKPWIPLADAHGLVLASPDARRRREWTVPADGPNPLRDLVADVRVKVVGIDDRRVYLFGYSAGAVFALYMGLTQAEYFAAVAAYAGALDAEADVSQLPRPQRRIPILLLLGARDELFSLGQARSTERTLRSVGCAVELRILPGVDHGYRRPSSDAVNELAWDFLRQKQLTAAPRFVDY